MPLNMYRKGENIYIAIGIVFKSVIERIKKITESAMQTSFKSNKKQVTGLKIRLLASYLFVDLQGKSEFELESL